MSLSSNVTDELRKKITDRYDFLTGQKPEALIQGSGGFRRYFVLNFQTTLVLFENVEYGNAIYAMFREWKTYSQMTKDQVLANGAQGEDFIRVPHISGWKGRVKTIIKNRLGNEK